MSIDHITRNDRFVELQEVVVQPESPKPTQIAAAPKDYTWWPSVLAEVIAEYAGDQTLVTLEGPWEKGTARAAKTEWLKFQAAVGADREKTKPTLHLILRCISNDKTLASATAKLMKANLFVGIHRNEMNADLLDEKTALASRARRRTIQEESDDLSVHIDEDLGYFQSTCACSIGFCSLFIAFAILLQPFQTPTRVGLTVGAAAFFCICSCFAQRFYKGHRETNDSIAAQQAINDPSIALEAELERTERGA